MIQNYEYQLYLCRLLKFTGLIGMILFFAAAGITFCMWRLYKDAATDFWLPSKKTVAADTHTIKLDVNKPMEKGRFMIKESIIEIHTDREIEEWADLEMWWDE